MVQNGDIVEHRGVTSAKVTHSANQTTWGRRSRLCDLLPQVGSARDIAYLLRQRLRGGDREREEAGLALVERLTAVALPGYVIAEGFKSWQTDRAFLDRCRALGPLADRAAERKFLLREMLALVEDVPGDTAEAGVYQGASSWFICDHFADTERTHWAIDSFEGLSAPTGRDGGHWAGGDLVGSEEVVRCRLAGYRAEVLKGWIPEVFDAVDADAFAFVHIDVDIYEPTRDSLEFFYSRLSSGGVIVCDDYGFTSCPGATRAFDEFVQDKPEPVIHFPTGQGALIKR